MNDRKLRHLLPFLSCSTTAPVSMPTLNRQSARWLVLIVSQYPFIEFCRNQIHLATFATRPYYRFVNLYLMYARCHPYDVSTVAAAALSQRFIVFLCRFAFYLHPLPAECYISNHPTGSFLLPYNISLLTCIIFKPAITPTSYEQSPYQLVLIPSYYRTDTSYWKTSATPGSD